MANSGNFHSKKSNSPKIFCAWCQQWKRGHIVLKFTKGANWKIHKHSKADKPCKGSDKVVMQPNPPSPEQDKQNSQIDNYSQLITKYLFHYDNIPIILKLSSKNQLEITIMF